LAYIGLSGLVCQLKLLRSNCYNMPAVGFDAPAADGDMRSRQGAATAA